MNQQILYKREDRKQKTQPIKLGGNVGWPIGIRQPHVKPTALVLSSGGTKGLGILGFLQRMMEESLLDNLSAFSGCSVGAMIILLLLCGYTPEEISHVALVTSLITSFKEFWKIDKAMRDFGFVDHEKAVKHMREMVERKFDGKIPTLKELFDKTNKYIRFAVSNLTDHQPLYIDYISDPNMSCLEAATMSMLVPGLLTKMTYRGKLVCDGACVDPLPASYFDDNIHKVLCVAVVGTELKPEEGISSYMYSALSLTLDSLQEASTRSLNDNFVIVGLNLPEISVLDTAQDLGKRFQCYNVGVLTGMHCAAWYKGSSYDLYYVNRVLPNNYTSLKDISNKNQILYPGASRQFIATLKLTRNQRKEQRRKYYDAKQLSEERTA